MAQREQRGSATQPPPDSADIADMGKKQAEAMVDVQRQFMQTAEEVRREWVNRLKAEAELATEFANKITATKSIPETMGIYQEWMRRRMEMFASDMQKFMTLTTRLMPKGGAGGSS
jgi:hypothetical protein